MPGMKATENYKKNWLTWPVRRTNRNTWQKKQGGRKLPNRLENANPGNKKPDNKEPFGQTPKGFFNVK